MTRRVDLITVGAACAVLTTLFFVVGIALMVWGGVPELIPETGRSALDWIKDVDDADSVFFTGSWLVIAGGLLGLVAFVGFWRALREASELMILAPILGGVGLTLVTISHLLPIAMAYELVPGYVNASAGAQESLRVTTDTLAKTALVLNYTGDALIWGLAVPLYAWAALKTRVVPRWIGWLGIGTAVAAGWVGLFAYAFSVLEGITFLGLVGFFLWMASMGVALLRRR